MLYFSCHWELLGEWSYKNTAESVVASDFNDNLLEVVYGSNHLSDWNVDWNWEDNDLCRVNINVIDALNINQLAMVDHFIVNIPSAPIMQNSCPIMIPQAGTAILYNIPVGYTGTVTLHDANDAFLRSITANDLCGGIVGHNFDSQVDLSITPPPPPTSVTMALSCPSGNVPGYTSFSIPFEAVLSARESYCNDA